MLRAVLLLSLLGFARGCRPSVTCDEGTVGAPTVCHATWTCTFQPTVPGASTPLKFYLDQGVDDATGLLYNFSHDPGSLIGGTYGGSPSCTPAGCDVNDISLTFQSVDLQASYTTGECEVGDTPSKCNIESSRKNPIPSTPPLPFVSVRVRCANQVLPCIGMKAKVTVDFKADVAWPTPPPSPPSPPPPPAPPPSPPSPPPSPSPPPAAPPAPAAFAPGGSGTKALGNVFTALVVFCMAYGVVGYTYVRYFVRDELPGWSWLDRLRMTCQPWRCDEELANGGGEGTFKECELLWCWCVPWYWRHSEADAEAAFLAYHPVDGDD